MNREISENKIFKFFDSILNNLITYIIVCLVGPSHISYILGGIVAQHKVEILLIVFGIPILFCIIFFAVLVKVEEIVKNPLKNYSNITVSDFKQDLEYTGLPENLKGYIEPGFYDTGIPHNSPLGKDLYTWTQVNAGYHDPYYKTNFGHEHEGIDLGNTYLYKQENHAFKLTGNIIMFATCSGQAQSFTDGAGGNYIYIVCDGSKYSIILLHNSINFIKKNDILHVRAGQPVAIMGSTGNSTGPHIHYQVRDFQTGKPLDPKPFINKEILKLSEIKFENI